MDKRLKLLWMQGTSENSILRTFDFLTAEDDGFAETSTLSPYCFYTRLQSGALPQCHPLFCNDIELPDYWEVYLGWLDAEIRNCCRKQAKVYFSDPIDDHCVRQIDWIDSNNNIYRSDHYDQYGLLFYSEFYSKGIPCLRSYYDANRRTVIEHQLEYDVVMLRNNTGYSRIFSSQMEFMEDFYRNIIIPADGQVEKAHNARKYETRTNRDMLILTNSQYLEGIREIAAALPESEIHIGANTQMGEELLKLREAFPNIHLYPGIGEDKLNELIDHCSFLLDINYYDEIRNIVKRAMDANMLVIGYEGTVHYPELMIKDLIIYNKNHQAAVKLMKDLTTNREMSERMVTHQNEKRELSNLFY